MLRRLHIASVRWSAGVPVLEQPYIIDTEKTVGEALKEKVAKLGENMQVRRFVRFNLGEGIEKKSMSFADEAMSDEVPSTSPATAHPSSACVARNSAPLLRLRLFEPPPMSCAPH